MPRFPDPHARLGSALADSYQAQIIESHQTPWASATFSGARHHYCLRVPREAVLESGDLNEKEFALPGHILADIVLNAPEESGGAHIFTVEALTVEDA